jgi:hypothetical protein
MEVKEASTWRRRRERVWKRKGQNLAERETSGKQNMGRDESAVDPASPSVTTVKEGCHKLNRVRHVVADKVGKENLASTWPIGNLRGSKTWVLRSARRP